MCASLWRYGVTITCMNRACALRHHVLMDEILHYTRLVFLIHMFLVDPHIGWMRYVFVFPYLKSSQK